MITYVVSYIWLYQSVYISKDVVFIVPSGALLSREMKLVEQEMQYLGYKLVSKVVAGE